MVWRLLSVYSYIGVRPRKELEDNEVTRQVPQMITGSSTKVTLYLTRSLPGWEQLVYQLMMA